jgi:uncharacterized protein
VLAGLLSGLLGVGGGFVMVPLLVLWAHEPERPAHGTSLAAIVPISLAGLAVYYFARPTPQVDIRFALLLVVGSVVGAYIGARAEARLPERVLRSGVAVLLLLVGLKEVILP